jgi:RNA polymerase subunit RPABC4/transcription elongation factor Spt4
MLRVTCAQLSAIAKLLREKYDAQFAMVVSDAPAADLRRGEAELVQINRLMTRHRRICPQCKSILAIDAPGRPRPFLFDMVS